MEFRRDCNSVRTATQSCLSSPFRRKSEMAHSLVRRDRCSLAKTVGNYIEHLTLGQGCYAGERFKLLGWQKRFLAGAFGQPGDAALTMGRAGGKSTFCSAIACAAVDANGPLVEPMAECLLVASSFDQGLVNFRHMLHFLTPSFERYGTGPRGRFRIQDSANRATIADRETGAMVRVLGSDPRRLHGAAPKLLLYDEVAQWPPERVEPMLAAVAPINPICRRNPSIPGLCRIASPTCARPFELSLPWSVRLSSAARRCILRTLPCDSSLPP